MNPPKCSDDDYINFVIATPRSVSATEAAKVQGQEEQAPAHDAFTRLLHRLEPDAETLWVEARSQISLSQGILVIDDSTLDKPYARKMELVTRHWSGNIRRWSAASTCLLCCGLRATAMCLWTTASLTRSRTL